MANTTRDNSSITRLAEGYDIEVWSLRSAAIESYAVGCVHHWFGNKNIGHGTAKVTNWGERHDEIKAAIVAGVNARLAA